MADKDQRIPNQIATAGAKKWEQAKPYIKEGWERVKEGAGVAWDYTKDAGRWAWKTGGEMWVFSKDELLIPLTDYTQKYAIKGKNALNGLVVIWRLMFRALSAKGSVDLIPLCI